MSFFASEPPSPPDDDLDEERFALGVVTRLTGLSPELVRAWERRYGVPCPPRSAHGARLFSSRDVDELREMKRLRDRGIDLGRASTMVRTERVRRASSADAAAETRHDAARLAVWALVDASARLDVDALSSFAAGAMNLGTPGEVAERVFAPALAIVARRSFESPLGLVGARLFASAVAGRLRPSRAPARAAAKTERVVLAAVTDESSDLDLVLLATILGEAGVSPVVLGPHVRPTALASAVRALAPDLVVLSATSPIEASRAARFVAEYGAASGPVRWGLGGPAAPPLASHVEASGGLAFAPSLVASRGRVVYFATRPRRPEVAAKSA